MGAAISAMRAAMVAVASVVAAFGMALIIAPTLFDQPPAWLTKICCVVGGVCLGAGLYGGYHALYNPTVSLSSFCKQFLLGGFLGCVASICCLAAAAAVTPLSVYTGLSPNVISLLLSGLCGLVTNGVSNLLQNRSFFNQWIVSIFTGAAIRLISSGLQTWFGGNAGEAATIQERLALHLEVRAREQVAAGGLSGAFNACREFVAGFWVTGLPAVRDFLDGQIRQREREAAERGHHRTPSPPYGNDSDDYETPSSDDSLPDLRTREDGEVRETAPDTPFIDEFQQSREELPDPSAATVVEISSPDSHDPHDDVALPTIKEQVMSAYVDKLQPSLYDDNTFVESLHDLLALHKRQSKVSSEEAPANMNLIYTTISDGMPFAVGKPAQKPSSSGRKIEKNSERKRQTRKEESAVGLWSSKPFKRQKIATNGKKIVTVHKLIAPDASCNYKLADQAKEWVKFKEGMRVIGIMGAPQSGKTTLVQTILFKLGYTISEVQATITRIPIGIHAYVLHDDKLIIIECCEGIDPREKSTCHSPYGALLLEQFMYLFCMKLIYVMPFSSDKMEEVKKYMQNRMLMLMTGAAAHNLLRSQHFAFVLRAQEFSKEYEGQLTHLRDYFVSPQADDAHRNVRLSKKEREQLKDIHTFNKVTVHGLRKFEMDDSSTLREKYERQLQVISDNVISEKSDVYKDKANWNEQPIDGQRFYNSMKTIWEKLVNSKALEEVLANVRAKEEINDDASPVKDYFETVKSFIKKVPKDKEPIVRAYEIHIEQMRQKGEEFKQLEKEKQTPELFVESIIMLAELLLQYSLRMKDIHLKEEGIRLGLNGFTILVREGTNTMLEVMALRMALFNCKIMKYLTKPEIHNFYPDCWFLLIRFARSGFRLPIMGFDLWNVAMNHLQKTELNTQTEVDIYLKVLCLLNELTDADPTRCVPDLVRHINSYFSGQIPMERIAREFERETKHRIEDMVAKLLKSPSKSSAVYEEWLSLPNAWFISSDYTNEEFDSDQEKKKEEDKLLGTLMSRNFEILYRIIAKIFSKEIIKRGPDFVATKFMDRHEGIEKARLLLWKNVVDSCKQDKEMYRDFLKTNLLEVLLKEYLLNQKDELPEHFSQALNTLCSMIGAERCHKEDEKVKEDIRGKVRDVDNRSSRSNIHTGNDIWNKRYNTVERVTLTRLLCLENGVVSKLISYFCTREHHQGMQYLLAALITFLAHDEEILHLNEAHYFAKEKKNGLLQRIAAEMCSSVKRIKGLEENDKENLGLSIQYQSEMAVLKLGCQFVNCILANYYNITPRRRDETFFDNRETYDMLISTARQLYPLCTTSSPSSAGLKQQLDDLKQRYFNLVFNLGVLSEKELAEVLYKRGITNIVDQCSVSSVDAISILCDEAGFLKLHFGTKYEDAHKLVLLAADFLVHGEHNCFATISKELTAKIIQLQKERKVLEDEKKALQKWLNDEEEQRKERNKEQTRESTVEVRIIPTLATTEVKYAVEEEDIHEAVLDAYLFFLHNDIHTMQEQFGILLKFLDKLVNVDEKPFQLRQNKPNVAKMSQLHNFKRVLYKCGYYFKIISEEEHYITNEGLFNYGYACVLYGQLNRMKESNGRFELDNLLRKVSRESDLMKERLPLAFFDADHQQYTYHSTLPIQSLLKERVLDARVPSQLRYTLVRVTDKNSGNCYQGVYSPDNRLSEVMKHATSLGIQSLYKDNAGDLDLSQRLQDVGGIVIQLKGGSSPM